MSAFLPTVPAHRSQCGRAVTPPSDGVVPGARWEPGAQEMLGGAGLIAAELPSAVLSWVVGFFYK